MFTSVPLFIIFVCGALVINAQTLPPGSCSASYPCPAGQCCSQWGYCGTGSAYCGSATTSATQAVTPAPTTQAVTSAPATVPVTSAPPATTGSGSSSGGSCSASSPCSAGLCCSQWGYCGTGSAYCGTGCQGGPCQSGTVAPIGPTASRAPTAGTSAPITSAPITSGPTSSGVIKSIYIDYKLNYNDPASTVTQAIDAGYNLIILAFYLSSGPTDMAISWGGLTPAQQQTTAAYAHSKGAKILVSWGGSTQGQYDSLSASSQGSAVATWAVNNNLDGVDFDLEGFAPGFSFGTMSPSQTIQWCADITNAARNVLGASRVITHAPQAPYFGPTSGGTWVGTSGGYNAVYALAPSIDYFLVQFYNQGCYTTYDSIFKNSASQCGNNFPGTSVAEITSYSVNGYKVPMSKIVVGKPVLTSDAGNGWVAASTLHSWFVQAASDIGWNAGVMGWMWEDVTDNTNWITQIYP